MFTPAPPRAAGRDGVTPTALVLKQHCAARPTSRGCADQRSAFQAVPALLLDRHCAARPASRGCADQRSAFRAVPVLLLAQTALRRSPRFAGLCRPEVGVPSRPRACAQSALRRSPRFAGLCRPEVGVPVPDAPQCRQRSAVLRVRAGGAGWRLPGRRGLRREPSAAVRGLRGNVAARGGSPP